MEITVDQRADVARNLRPVVVLFCLANLATISLMAAGLLAAGTGFSGGYPV